MSYFYLKTDSKFFWHPYCQVSIVSDTATVNVNDFFTQELNTHWNRFGYLVTRHVIGLDGSRMTTFDEEALTKVLLCLSEYPVYLQDTGVDSYFDPNPWRSILESFHINPETLVRRFREKFPDIKKITATPDPADAIFFNFSQNSPLIRFLAQAGIEVVKTHSEAIQYQSSIGTTMPLYNMKQANALSCLSSAHEEDLENSKDAKFTSLDV